MRRTGRTKDLLYEIDVWPVSPIVVSPTETASMAAHGMI